MANVQSLDMQAGWGMHARRVGPGSARLFACEPKAAKGSPGQRPQVRDTCRADGSPGFDPPPCQDMRLRVTYTPILAARPTRPPPR